MNLTIPNVTPEQVAALLQQLNASPPASPASPSKPTGPGIEDVRMALVDYAKRMKAQHGVKAGEMAAAKVKEITGCTTLPDVPETEWPKLIEELKK